MFIRSIAVAGFLALLFATLFATRTTALAQGAEEMRCRSMLDGQVAWDQAGNTAWQPENIAALCAGATDADARIACFEAGIAEHNDWSRAIAECAANDGAAAMPVETAPSEDRTAEPANSEEMRCRTMLDGQVAWSQQGDTAWQPDNIEALCAGTTDADARIACFRAGIADHNDWSRAIADCVADDSARAPQPESGPVAPTPQPEPTTGGTSAPADDPETALCKTMIQGNIPMSMPNGSTNWDDASLDRLCRGSVNAMETLKCFIEALGNGGGTPRSTDQAIDICRAR